MNARNIFIAAGLVAGGAVLGAMAWSLLMNEEAVPAGPAEREVLYWVAPMDPSYRRDEPGQSPMGMDLVPVYADEVGQEDEAGIVRIDPAVENNIGVRTAVVERSPLSQRIATVGHVRPVDDQIRVIEVRTEGWIEDLRVTAMGDVVQDDALLFRMYAPDLSAAQSEFLQALRLDREALIRSARQRLLALGMSRRQIDAVARTGEAARLIDLRADQGGTALEIAVRDGQHVQPGTPLMTLADLSQVWIVADLFEAQAQAVRPGHPVEIRSPDQPGRVWLGTVEYVYPTVDAQSRAVPVRVRLDNADGALRPNSYVNVTIEAAPRRDVVQIPREALIRTRDSDRVILALGDGRYQPARVIAGQEAGGQVEIVEGLAPGERIVVSSQFLIDSEASLQGGLLRMSPPEGERDAAMAPAQADVQGVGRVVSLMSAEGRVRLEHEPIPAIGWPAMTMAFDIDPEVDLEGLEAGKRISFVLEERPEGGWLITEIVPTPHDAESGEEPQ
ncbi:efflux RND transporter periplasmic adaptor subunit [Maricaulis sp. CAU 1757]